MRTSLRISLATALVLSACEDGPQQVFTPNTGDPAAQNGYAPGEPWVQDGSKGYGEESGGDSVGRARFCDEAEAAAQIEQMVVAPIIPDTAVGTVPLWSADGQPLHADDLLGRPEDGKLCDPTEPYANAFVYGPTQEVIVFFNQDTRLVEGVMAYTSYLGALEGTYTKNGRQVPVVIKPRERLQIDGVELDQYTSRADQGAKPRAWLNYQNVSAVYAMLRETFFNAPPFPDDFNCITEKLCDVVYTGSNESNPQDAFIVVQDTGVQMRFTPDGYVTFVYAEPVRAAPFEGKGSIDFGASGSAQMAMRFDSTSRGNCRLPLDEAMTFGTFKQRCIDAGDQKTLARASYQVDEARDAVDVGFNGITLSFLRDTSTKPVLKDGEAPDDDDVLYGVGFTRSLSAVVDEFRPRTLGNLYKAKLEARLLDAVGGAHPEQHPLALYSVPVPFVFDSPQPIDALETPVGKLNWVQSVMDQVTALYYSLSPEEQAVVSSDVLSPLFLVEPFVDAVLEVFTHPVRSEQAFEGRLRDHEVAVDGSGAKLDLEDRGLGLVAQGSKDASRVESTGRRASGASSMEDLHPEEVEGPRIWRSVPQTMVPARGAPPCGRADAARPRPRGAEARWTTNADLDVFLKRLHLANARRVGRDLVQRAENAQWSHAQLLETIFA